jgi:hypothetical protein
MGQRQVNLLPHSEKVWSLDFLQMTQCLQLVHGTKQQSCGARKLGRCGEIQSIVTVVEELTAFGFRRLVNFLKIIVGQDSLADPMLPRAHYKRCSSSFSPSIFAIMFQTDALKYQLCAFKKLLRDYPFCAM